LAGGYVLPDGNYDASWLSTRRRAGIERRFAHLCGFAGGLQPLSRWVRGPDRVRTRVWVKLLINGVRILRKELRLA
jgi:hypothetical protein